jgi:phosphoribosylaminoimidazolecarboxamide formyltransferase/IMP cyclohydrolase
MTHKKINTAIISVSDKSGLEVFGLFLKDQGVHILSTGGTAKFLRDKGIEVTDISDHTDFPEIMDGRVKTLHPKVHGGILSKSDDEAHEKQRIEQDITRIDMVVVNLYPFEETIKKDNVDFDTCIENIDIGGPSMIRSAAKNHADCTIVVNPADYDSVVHEMQENDGATSDELRQRLAASAFARTASYDAAISTWFAKERDVLLPETLAFAGHLKNTLRYGENPHQDAGVYLDGSDTPGVATAVQVQGKELSYNNLSDADAAYDLVNEFSDPAVAIIKHANPCGAALGNNLLEAYENALACDPVSAYGSIIALNREIDEPAAKAIAANFVEVIIAPSANEAARKLLESKKNLRLLLTGTLPDKSRNSLQVKTIAGGFLVQQRDYLTVTEKDLEVVTKRKPSPAEIEEMLFAFSVCKHVKSNAIVFTKDRQTVGIGAGQMSRVDSVKIAGWKMGEDQKARAKEGGLTLASDAFFPFADGLISAAENGVSCVIQPGGSIRDEEVIKAADERDIAMVFTGKRHFKH